MKLYAAVFCWVDRVFLDGTGSYSHERLPHFSQAAMVQDLSGVFHDQQLLQ